MSKEETIDRWMDIAAAVFRAEDAISQKWFPELRKAKDLPPGEKRALADSYLRAIATEIVENSGVTFDDKQDGAGESPAK